LGVARRKYKEKKRARAQDESEEGGRRGEGKGIKRNKSESRKQGPLWIYGAMGQTQAYLDWLE
jgi:hypothetical protein